MKIDLEKNYVLTGITDDNNQVLISFKGRYPQKFDILTDENGNRYFVHMKNKIEIEKFICKINKNV